MTPPRPISAEDQQWLKKALTLYPVDGHNVKLLRDRLALKYGEDKVDAFIDGFISKPHPKPSERVLVRHCIKCGKGKIIAFGSTAMAITRAQIAEWYEAIGWTTAPRFVCVRCACPMTKAEMDKAAELFWAIKELRDGGEKRKEQFELYWGEIQAKYGEAVDKYFQSIRFDNEYED